MYNIDLVAKIYFNCVSIQSIFNETVKYDRFSEKEFQRLESAYFLQYSDTETRKLQEMISESVRMEGHPYASMNGRSGENVFAELEEVAEELLTEEDDRVLCQYNHLLRFRDVTSELEEDLLICAYLAVRSRRYGQKTTNFLWDTSVGHNNMQLNRIMEEGISENHFHLYGSAAAYELIWLRLMNWVCTKDYEDLFEEIDQAPRKTRVHYYSGYTEETSRRLVLKAAFIRVNIMAYLLNIIRDGKSSNQALWSDYSNVIKNLPDEEDIESEESNTMYEDTYKSKALFPDYIDIKKVLTDEENIEDRKFNIQDCIDLIKSSAQLHGSLAHMTDYALAGLSMTWTQQREENAVFAGERWLVYTMLERELREDQLGLHETPKILFQWFYAYLAIKSRFRGELVQCNKKIGFENFKIYTGRKRGYMDRKRLIRSAVSGSMASGNLQSLEIRISPKKTALENKKMIREIEHEIGEISGMDQEDWKKKIYYVFHFSKKTEPKLTEEKNFDAEKCRHYKFRRELNEKANAVLEFRRRFPVQASRVYGIDACSQEIGCRPEVFASVFRYLSEDVQEQFGIENDVGQLKLTYHVGEDFLDVVDGLRAVDEAVRFLNLQCGDRIGHGTVLGIDVRDWYKTKDCAIFISQQDYLDNVMWLSEKLAEFKVKDTDILRQYLQSQFDDYYARIYGDLRGYSDSEKNVLKRVTMNDYYEAWKLRGDEPSLYINKEYDKRPIFENQEYLIGMQKDTHIIRRRPDINLLYYRYHYDWKVRSEGSKVTEIYIPSIYIEGVEKLQKEMQHFVAERGIGVEANPSSNLQISTMHAYQDHPIIRLYNKDLVWDMEKVKNCAQVNISINTDDKGVFHTSLENEYALMACALEKSKDESGGHMYNRQMIYQWLDNIRRMGNMQRFKK